MNDEDYLALSQEIDQKTYFTKVDGGKGKSKSELGREGVGFSVATNWVENVIDSPYCPKGTAYILSSDTIALWTYTNADKIADGVSGNEAGKPEVNGESTVQDKPYQLLVDDMFTTWNRHSRRCSRSCCSELLRFIRCDKSVSQRCRNP